MSDSETKSEIKSLLISGAGVAAVSIIGYVLAFNYERGYANYFEIPIRLIQLNLITILTAVLGLCSVFFIVVVCISFVSPLLQILPIKFSSPIIRKLLGQFPVFVICLVLLIIYRATWGFWSSFGPYLLYFAFIWLCYEFISPLLLYPQKETYSEKLEAVESHRNPSNYFQLSNSKDLSILLVCSIVLLIMFADDLGNSEAIRKKNFLVLTENKKTVVLRIYDDKYICAPFNRETKQIDRSLIILESSGQKELKFNLEKVGPLKLVDIKDE